MNQHWFPGHWRIYTEYNVAIDNFDIYLAHKTHQDKIEVLLPAEFKQSGTAPVRVPWISGETGISQKTFLQDMLDAAWELGLRPTSFADQSNALEATKTHLRDMRAIVADKLKVQLP